MVARHQPRAAQLQHHHLLQPLEAGVGELAVEPLQLQRRQDRKGCRQRRQRLEARLSALDRSAASEEDLRRADTTTKELEAAGGPVDFSKDLDKLQGRWKLIYSSAFSSCTLGGSRPGPPIGGLLHITLGQVFQRIDVVSKDFGNIVELQFVTPSPLPPAEATTTLAYKFEVTAVMQTDGFEHLKRSFPFVLRAIGIHGEGE